MVASRERMILARQLSEWWQRWCGRRAAIAELACSGSAELSRVAHDVGLNRADLCILAGRWPNSATLLTRWMEQLNLAAAEQVKPQVIQDLERDCTFCTSKRKCEHSLAEHPGDLACGRTTARMRRH